MHLVDKVDPGTPLYRRTPIDRSSCEGHGRPEEETRGDLWALEAGRRWRAIIIVIIPIKKLIIGAGSPPADPIMGWFSSPPPIHSPFSATSLLCRSESSTLGLNPPPSAVVKAVG